MKELHLSQISDNAFLPMRMCREVVKARVLSDKERVKRESGSPDILITSLIGEKRLVYRKDIIEKYRYISGKKIKMAGWKVGKEYLLVGVNSYDVRGAFVPKDYRVIADGLIENRKVINSNEYIIANLDEQGNLIRDNMYYISKKLFRKCLVVLPSEELKAVKNKQRLPRKKMNIQEEIENNFDYENVEEASKKVLNESVKRREAKVPNREVQRTSAKLEAVGICKNSSGVIVGFILKSNKGVKRFSKKEVMMLCSKKMVSNIMLTKKEDTGKYYLRGNGIVITQLKEYRV